MIGHSAATWAAALPIGAVVLLVLLGPGWVAARLVGARGFAALAVAPAVSVTTLTVGGVLASTLGIGWRSVTALGCTLLTWLVALLVGLLLRRSRPRVGRRRRATSPLDGDHPDDERSDDERSDDERSDDERSDDEEPAAAPDAPSRWSALANEWLWPLIALAVAAAGLAVAFLPVAGHPSSFPQQPDTIQHLGIVQWMLDRHDISTLHAAGFVYPTPRFYPAGFHDVVVSAVQLCATLGIGGATPVVGATMVSLATAAVIWPLGCLLLARTVLGASAAVALATGVTATAFSAFPLWLMGYGVLWPNLLGYALMPAALACLVVGVRPHLPADRTGDDPATSGLTGGERTGSRRTAWLLLLAGLPGLTLAHPNALVSVAVLGVLVVLDAVLRQAWAWRRGRPRAAAGVVVAALAGTALLAVLYALATQRMTSMRASNPPGPEMSLRTAIDQVVLQSPRGAPPLHVLGALVVIGALVLLWRGRGRRWVVAALVVTGALYVVVVGSDTATTRWFTWPWYNNPPRLAALVVLPAMLCAATALAAPALAALRWWAGRRRAGSPTSAPRIVATALAVLLPAAFVVVTGGYVDQHHEMIDRYWHPSKYRSWASDAELKALRELSRSIGPDDVTVANPWNGATYLYLVSGRRLLIPSEKVRSPGDRSLLAERLDQAGTDPQVCAAARREHVRFAITGGRPFSSGSTDWQTYPGIKAVPRSPAFTKVETSGPYTLWRLTSCAGG